MVSRWVIRSLFSKRSINPTKNPAVAGFLLFSRERTERLTITVLAVSVHASRILLEILELTIIQSLGFLNGLVNQSLGEFDRASYFHSAIVGDVLAEVVFDVDLVFGSE